MTNIVYSIPLSRGLIALVDECDYQLVSTFNWTAQQSNHTFYAQNTVTLTNGKRTGIMMHRMILGFNRNDPLVDHIDGDGLNNTRANLRVVTHKQNTYNRKSNSMSGYKGVKNNKYNKWIASFKGLYLGTFETKELAAKAYDKAAKDLYGEYARLNFPEVSTDKQLVIIPTNRPEKYYTKKHIQKINNVKDMNNNILSTKFIPLTHGLFAIVDDKNYDKLVSIPWYAKRSRNTFYAVYRRKGITSLAMHRVILGLTNEKIKVDHRDGNGLNNTLANLRLADSSQNSCNAVRRSDNTSGYTGVTRSTGKLQWIVHIKKNGVLKTVGRFDDIIVAAKAYDEAAIKLHGEFARLNFPRLTFPV